MKIEEVGLFVCAIGSVVCGMTCVAVGFTLGRFSVPFFLKVTTMMMAQRE